ncbi:hypothetical protein N657DRAFT_620259 [Parathielavia appendiculata]|uniref:Uncharacterized protein n=1 Tax=Parathielavia appendiculata TaxID=2587402 RepID=A0AAN6TZH5_9PEZI|nr:hypothetical protein N657DRAFT_620259 [Parathielavia appendiculata]
MLDENLPTFRLKPSSDNPLSSILYFTQNGSEPAAEYLLLRADPALPASRNRYAIALCDPYNASVVYGEVMIEPEWSQPTLSAAEIRAQSQAGAPPPPVVPVVPDSFTVQLYNPDQAVTVKMAPGSWNKTDSWEFELPVQTFRTPTASELDREQQNASPAAADLVPRVMFRWKKDGLLSKDMTCYMTGTRLGARKNKEPDITVGLFKAAKESVLTVYQPNLHRVEVEDRKGLELVLLLASEVIKDFWLAPKSDVFNVQGGSGSTLNGNKSKNSRPVATTSSAAVPAAMSGAIEPAAPPQPAPSTTAAAVTKPITAPSASNPSIDAETRRLQAMVEREQREREKAERAEQKRIKKMIEEEEKERRRREAEVAKETERLRKLYGVEGQDLPSDRPPLPPRATPAPPPAAGTIPPPQTHPHPLMSHPPPPPQLSPGSWAAGGGGGGLCPQVAHGPLPMLPPRPVSAGPFPGRPGSGGPPQPGQHGQQQGQGPFHSSTLNALWKGAAGGLQQLQTQVQQHHHHQGSSGGGGSKPGGRRKTEEGRAKVQKKRSSHW